MKKNLVLLSALSHAMANAHNFGGNDDLIIRELKNASMNYHNFSGNNSAFGFTADELASNPDLARLVMSLSGGRGGMNFDADAMNFDADAMNFGGLGAFGFNVDEMLDPKYLMSKNRMRYSASEIAAANLTTFKMRVIYTPVALVPQPVRIQLFGMTFGLPYTFTTEGNLLFTNAGGDTVEVRGLTRPMRQLYAVTDTEPFRLAFVRMTPQSTSQLDNPVRVENQSQWNSGKFNEINPDIYNDPNQYQQLNIDVPFNMVLDKKNGFLWDIDPDQTSPGIGLAFFISQQLKPADALSNKDTVRNLNMGINPAFTVPSMSQASAVKNRLLEIAQNPAVKNVVANSALIKTMGR